MLLPLPRTACRGCRGRRRAAAYQRADERLPVAPAAAAGAAACTARIAAAAAAATALSTLAAAAQQARGMWPPMPAADMRRL